ncbi:hypothetical protein AB4212_08185 [Streptomyces sp. 2MCAF27]
MNPEMVALAGTAGTTLVTILTTEARQSVREGFTSLWRRAQPDRADAISAELEATRSDLLTAQVNGEGRIRRLLMAHPEEMEALRTLLNELAPHTPTPEAPSVTQAGRDQNFGQR